MSSTDRIEKKVTLRASIQRVWRAISNAEEFGQWFGFTLEGPFTAGETIKGTFHGALDEAAIVAYQESLGLQPSKVKVPEKSTVFCTVQRIEPERYFSFRWIPYGIDADADLENEPTTLVTRTKTRIGLSSGRVMFQNMRNSDAPSSEPAS